ACTIRAWSRGTVRVMTCQSKACHSVVSCEVAPAMLLAVICLPPPVGWPNSRVRKDQREVGSLSRGMLLRARNPYPAYYRLAFASSLLRYPPDYRQSLRTAFPPGIRRAYRVLLVCPSGVGPPCSPTASWSRRGEA